jgi:hypothetical protein
MMKKHCNEPYIINRDIADHVGCYIPCISRIPFQVSTSMLFNSVNLVTLAQTSIR